MMIHIGVEDHGRRIMGAFGSLYSPVTMQVISRTENGELYGGVIYENYTGKGGSILVHIAGFKRNWINRDLLYIMFDYPFRQLDCKMAFAQIRGKNTQSREFCKTVGFVEIATFEGVFADDYMVVMKITRDGCRHMKVKSRNIAPRKVATDEA